jgi:Uncharacterised nucleotidyltransferase
MVSSCKLGGTVLENTLPANSPFASASIEKEWKFLCFCACPASDAAALKQISFLELDWDLVLEIAEEHGMLGVLAMRLQEINFARVPTASRDKLQSRLRSQYLFTLSMTAELFRILDDFSKCGIETLLVKGPLISLLAYGDPAVRSYVDLDLLVRHKYVLTATQHMIDLGFESDVPLNAIEAGKIPGEYLFKRPGTAQIIELHTERTFRYYPRSMRLEDLFARQRRVPLDGHEIPALGLEDEFVLNSIHGAKHFWERLMWVADIAAIVARHPEINWEKAQQAAADVGAGRMLHVALQLAETLLGVRLPAGMATEVKRDATVRKLCGQVARWLPYAGYAPPELKERALFRMRMGGGGLAGAGYLLRLSLSPTEEDWVEGDEEGRSGLMDAIQRPFRLLKKYRSSE